MSSLTPSLFVDGEWATASGPVLAVLNPATEEEIAEIRSASEADVDAALNAARRAQRTWERLPAVGRSKHLRQIADVIETHTEVLAGSLVDEVGKPIAQARGEVGWAVAYIRYTAEWDRRIEGEIVPSDEALESIHLLRGAVGVVAAICAWNFPLALFFRKVAPALLTGNTVVAKPSETTPLTTIRAVALISEHAPLPNGVLNLVNGGPETGRALVASPLTNLVTMTGHRDSGKKIMAQAAGNLTRVSLELGGKAPAIVCKDADLDLAVGALVTARHANSGQVCTSAERMYVHQDLFDRFVAAYTEAVRGLRLGSPLEDVDVGPLASAAQREKLETAVEQATGGGANVLTGGSRPAGLPFDRGYWFQPTVVVDVDPEMSIMHDEAFGPVTPIVPVRSLDQALELANDSRYGLSAYLFTNDYRTAMRATAELDCGEIYVNRTLGEAMQGHHSGHRESGIGGEDGRHGILKYTQLKTVYHRYG